MPSNPDRETMNRSSLVGVVLLLAAAPQAEAQLWPGRSVPLPTLVESAIAIVPFGPGERAEYQVKLGIFSVGDGLMEVSGIEPVRGRPSYRFSWKIEGGIPFARVNDHFQSWMDIETLASRRFIQEIHEVRYHRYRHFEIYPEEGRWELQGAGEVEEFTVPIPLDDIAFVYFVRTLPLEVGETYEFELYFRQDRNPVTLEVLRRERITVPAGTFDTIVIRPIIKSDGLFGEGGDAELYFTDDDRRVLVRLESRVLSIGSLSLHLREYREGRPLRTEAAAH
jgi:hypothetical protein